MTSNTVGFQEPKFKGNFTHEKLAKIANYWGNTNQHANRVSLAAVRVAVITVYKRETLERPWRKGSSKPLLGM